MSQYAEAHVNPQGPGDARPTALQIVKDEDLIGKLTGRVFFITGCSDGIGVETANAIHATGATVYATGRNEAKTKAAIERIYAADPENKAPIHFIKLELDSLVSVRSAAEEFLKKSDKLNVLINNAGVRYFNSYLSYEDKELIVCSTGDGNSGRSHQRRI